MINLTRQDIQFMLAVLTLTDDLRERLDALASEKNKAISDDLADALGLC